MSWSIKLFRVKGIDVKVHLTFVLILIWAAYRWSGSTGEGLQGALFGVAATLLLFGSVTLHELGHSLQALKYGVRVRDITLLPIGGLARMEEIPEKPGQELRIAIAGPLVNFAIAAALIGVGALLQAQALVTVPELFHSLGAASWTGMLAYLTMANLAMGLFNLIPAFPMDGGRVLRALLAMRLDYPKATSIAVTIGQGLALLLGLYGFMSGSFTLVLIAVFVWMGAGQEGKQVEVKSVLREMKVGQAMTRQPQILSADDSLARAVELTLTTSQADFPVMERESGRLVGLLTEGDLLKGLRSHNMEASVGQVMRTRFPTATPSEPIFQAQQQMALGRVRAMPILEGGDRLVGLLTVADINEAYRLLSVSPGLAPAQ
jgi:Zn-dependent protease/predicted transcriptional regulator